MAAQWIVVKVGGSLFHMPYLGSRLRDFCVSLKAERVLFVPGGGATAEAVRDFDRAHQVGEEASHWLAIQALSINAQLLQALLPESRIVADEQSLTSASGWHILDAFPFFREDEMRADHLPHGWQVTSDSLAARAAVLAGARTLILLKSVGWDGSDWTEAARVGIVDDYFARAVQQASEALHVQIVNLRAWR
jgi:aspartokinase-like uncharacterized kinase